MSKENLTYSFFDYQSKKTPRHIRKVAPHTVEADNLFTAQRLLSDCLFAHLQHHSAAYGEVALPAINPRDYSAEAVSSRVLWFIESMASRAKGQHGSGRASALLAELTRATNSAFDELDAGLTSLGVYHGKIAAYCAQVHKLVAQGMARLTKKF